jgi:hypothetical protein
MEHNVEPVPGRARCPGEDEIAPRAGNVFRALDSGTVRVDIRVAEGSLYYCLQSDLSSSADGWYFDICVHLENYATCNYNINISRAAGRSKEQIILE